MISSEEFESIMTTNGFTVEDAKEEIENNEQYKCIDKYLIAENENGLKISYTQFTTKDYAIMAYENFKYELEHTGRVRAYYTVTLGNYGYYSLRTGGKYYYICRVDDTIVYTQTTSQLRSAAKDIINKLGY